jgi:tRNA threonylcarbamoyladenosine biosynthesis protein TsaE
MLLQDSCATENAGRALAPHVRAGDVITLSGNLGAGKTSLARGLLQALGLVEDAPSPSFSLVIPYTPPLVRLPVSHVDLYRLDRPGDLMELGLDDVTENGILIIEWPENLGGMTWPDMLRIRLDIIESGGRSLTAIVPPSWEDRWPFT